MLDIESVINRYLALDPEMLDKMAAFSGKVIKLEIVGLGAGKQSTGKHIAGKHSEVDDAPAGHAQNDPIKQLYIFPGDSGLSITDEYDGAVDTILRGSPIALFKMGLLANSASLLLKGEVEISGDTRLGHQFKLVFSQMDIDWSEYLSNFIGDELAYKVQQSGRQFLKWGQASLKSFSMSVSEYLQEESRDAVTETELQIFNNKVDKLREDVDRLQARCDVLIRDSLSHHKV